MITGCDISISVFLVGIVAGEAKRSDSIVSKDVNIHFWNVDIKFDGCSCICG